MINIEELKNKAIQSINDAKSIKDLDDIRVNYFGKKGEITSIMQSFKDMAAEDRKEFGKIINDARQSIEELIRDRHEKFNAILLNEKLKRESIDVSLPSKKVEVGHYHPCTIVFNDVKHIFEKMGYSVVTGPEIEYDEYNFEKLNIEKGHPARDEQDTFYINERVLLRTQTSPVQARVMEKGKLPICIISAGRVFRSDSVDATHSPTFHQIEGLVVDENISAVTSSGLIVPFTLK